jgi:hypothetical protein
MVSMTVAAVFASGCGVSVSQKHAVPAAQVRPELEATKGQLITRYNEQARAIQTLNATVDLLPTTGSAYSGVIEEYHDVDGFVLAKRPASIRVIGQAPVVGKNIFDMVSDGETFRIFIPPKGKFIVGPARFEHASKKPLENLRPQHILEAIFWPPLEPGGLVLFAEEQEAAGRYYVLTVVSRGENPEVTRRIWFDRSDLNLARVEDYEAGGRLVSVARYSDWQAAGDGASYPRKIALDRPRDDYRLDLHITTLTLNAEIADDRFHLEQPPGTELVRVGEKDQDAGGASHP